MPLHNSLQNHLAGDENRPTPRLTRRELCVRAAFGAGALFQLPGADQTANEGTFAVHADMLYTVIGAPIRNGVVLIRGGRIVSVGDHIPNGVKIVRAATVMPALVDPHSYVGCYYEAEEPVDAVTPDFRIADGFDTLDPMAARAAQTGITTFAIMPGNRSVLGGQAAIVRNGLAVEIISRSAGQKVSATQDAANPERNPTSRAGAIALLRDALNGAKNGRAVSSTSQTTTLAGYPTSLSERVESLLPLLQRRSRAYFHAPASDDVENALQIIDSYALKAALVHSAEGYVVADRIAAHKLPVILAPLKFGDTDHVLANAARLLSAGVPVSFCTDSPLTAPESLRLSAHIAVHYGMKPGAALRAITLNPAQAIGVSHLVGSIEAGKEADLLLMSGDPLNLTSRVDGVLMRGQLLPRFGING